jgi:predicted O-methyltransferase YrrM
MQPKSYSEKLLPNQEFFRYLYKGQLPFEKALYNLVASYATEFSASQFRLATPKSIGFEQMSTPPWELALFNAFIKFIDAKNVLEVGTFIGHSTMQIARMVGDGGHVTTIEVGREFSELAGENFRSNGFDDRITLLEGDAGQILDNFEPNTFDLVFIDGGKQDYLDYTLKSIRLLTHRGAILVDDIFFHGDALNDEPSTDKGRGCKDLLAHFAIDNSCQKLLLPIANGLLLLYKTRA